MNTELARTFGIATRQAREAVGLTREEAADLINISVEFYAGIELGNVLPSLPSFARLVSALGASADALLGNERPKETDPTDVDGPDTGEVALESYICNHGLRGCLMPGPHARDDCHDAGMVAVENGGESDPAQ